MNRNSGSGASVPDDWDRYQRPFEILRSGRRRCTNRRRTTVRARPAQSFVHPIVLAEFAWTLRTTFKLDRTTVYDRLAGIVTAPEFTLANPQATGRAVEQYGMGAADFADCLIGEINHAVFGCETTVTFDKAAAKVPAFRHLPI